MKEMSRAAGDPVTGEEESGATEWKRRQPAFLVKSERVSDAKSRPGARSHESRSVELFHAVRRRHKKQTKNQEPESQVRRTRRRQCSFKVPSEQTIDSERQTPCTSACKKKRVPCLSLCFITTSTNI